MQIGASVHYAQLQLQAASQEYEVLVAMRLGYSPVEARVRCNLRFRSQHEWPQSYTYVRIWYCFALYTLMYAEQFQTSHVGYLYLYAIRSASAHMGIQCYANGAHDCSQTHA